MYIYILSMTVSYKHTYYFFTYIT